MRHIFLKTGLFGLLWIGLMSTAFVPNNQAVDLKLTLKKGQKFKQWVLNDQTIIQTIQGREQRINQTIGTGYAYEVLEAGPQKYKLKVRFYRMLFNQEVPNMPQLSSAYDSEDPHDDLNTLEVAFAVQVDKNFEITLDQKANILEVSGTEKMVEEMMDDLEKLNSQMATPEMKKNLNETMGPNNLKSSMRQLIISLPKQAIGVGDTWRDENQIKSLMTMKTYTEYEAIEINARTATIKIDSELETPENATMEMAGTQLDVGMGGTIQGSYMIDIKSGFLKAANYEMEAIGDLSMQGMTVPMVIQTKTSISLEK